MSSAANAAAVPSAVSSSRNRVLLGLLVVLQIADFFTTDFALAHSALGEGNPAMAWCFSSQGILGIAFGKVALLGFVALATNSIPRWSLALIVVVSALAAGNNLFHVAPLLTS